MIRLLLASLMLLSAVAEAEIYKWVDADGRTQFSDRPRPDAQAVGAKPKPLSSHALAPAKDEAANRLGPYSSFEIVTPEANQVLRQPEGAVPVSLLLVPELKEGHHLELVLDGSPVPVDRSLGTQLSLSGVGFGSHQAQARVLDPEGAVIATTPLISFHLRKPIPPGVLP
jgi:hypothetical protein